MSDKNDPQSDSAALSDEDAIVLPDEGAVDATSRPIISLADFQSTDFEEPLRGVDCVAQEELASIYRTALDQARAASDDASLRVFELIEAICSIHLRPYEKGDVWVAMASGPGWSTATPEIFVGQQSGIFAEVAKSIKHPALRARMADIAWTNNRKDGKTATVAAEAYRDCVDGLVDGTFKPWLDKSGRVGREISLYLERMMQIVNATTKKTKRPEWVSRTVRSSYELVRDKHDFVAFEKIARIALYYDLLSETEARNDAESLAKGAVSTVYPLAVKVVLDLAAQLHQKAGDVDGFKRCKLGAVDCLLAMRGQVSGAAAAASWTMDALQELRHIPGNDERERELEMELRRLQKSSLSEMGSIPIEMDIEKQREEVEEEFSRFSLADGLRRFAMIGRSPDIESLRREALETAKNAPFLAMMSMSHVDDEGRTIVSTPGAPVEGEPGQAWFDNMIARSDSIRRLHVVGAHIDPARTTLNEMYGIEERHIEPIVHMSPFVPESQEPIVTLGFVRFFQGDFMSAAHLIIPQLEPCLRHILKINGIDPAKRRDDGTEEDLSLSGIYDRHTDALSRILTPALNDEIDRLFNRRPGPALRHELAHGQLSAGACFHPNVYYGIWLIYQVCCLFLIRRWNESVGRALAES